MIMVVYLAPTNDKFRSLEQNEKFFSFFFIAALNNRRIQPTQVWKANIS